MIAVFGRIFWLVLSTASQVVRTFAQVPWYTFPRTVRCSRVSTHSLDSVNKLCRGTVKLVIVLLRSQPTMHGWSSIDGQPEVVIHGLPSWDGHPCMSILGWPTHPWMAAPSLPSLDGTRNHKSKIEERNNHLAALEIATMGVSTWTASVILHWRK